MPVLSSDDKQENRLLHTDSVPSFYRGVQFSCLLLNPPGTALSWSPEVLLAPECLHCRWFMVFWAIVGFLLVWSMTWLTTSLLAKANLALVSEPGNGIEATSSFDSLVTTALSKRWAFLNNLCIMFIMMILIYAYWSF